MTMLSLTASRTARKTLRRPCLARADWLDADICGEGDIPASQGARRHLGAGARYERDVRTVPRTAPRGERGDTAGDGPRAACDQPAQPLRGRAAQRRRTGVLQRSDDRPDVDVDVR